MQRRKVDLPEPEGPRMQTTSPGCTSSSMPFSTSRRPKRLWTLSALTIGSLIESAAACETETQVSQPLQRRRRQAPREPRGRSGARCSTGRSEHGRDDQVPEARHDQERDRLVGQRVDELGRVEQLRERDHADERGRLQHRDGLVAGRRDDHPHRLGQHDPPHRLHAGHAERLRCLRLALVDREDAGAHDLGHVGGLVQPEPEQRRPRTG